MTQKALFEMLGAPLKNFRWSWGGARKRDGAIFLRVWEDRMRPHDGSQFVQVTHRADYVPNPGNPGYREREEHVQRIQGGASCYLVVCKAVDTQARPRKIESFNSSEVFRGGRVLELDGEAWVEIVEGVPVRTIRP